MNDIDFAGTPLVVPAWANGEPMNETGEWALDHATFFNGIFEGQGYTLSNITVTHPNTAPDGATWGSSIFGVIGKSGIVQNVSFSTYIASGTGQSTVIAQHNHGVIRNCRFSGIDLTATNGYYDPQCSNAVIAAFNYNLIENCVVASANYSNARTDQAVHAFVVRNRTNGVTNGDVKNCYAVYTGTTAPTSAAYTEAFTADGVEWFNACAPTFQGCVFVASGSVAGQAWTNLDPDAWDTSGTEVPVLKKPAV